MEETPNFWNKKQEDLEVADQLKLVALVPVVMMGSVIATGLALRGVDKIRSLIRRPKQVELAIVDTNTVEEA